MLGCATIAAGVVSGNRNHPYGDSMGPVAAIFSIVFFGWTPLPAAAAWLGWKARMTSALAIDGTSMRAIATPIGVGRPLIGWTGWRCARWLVGPAVFLTLYQFFADYDALPPTPVFVIQLVVLVAWTWTAVELIARCHTAARRRRGQRTS
ncbi:hypothetical protein GCM10011492_22060 [Flexivirga endophytica]|uniref:Uncharacterized protein n=2 Tax=Flexivirga endophytica TaxID=1849103 RepID=A0A916T5Z9_9MICO|nr:hypothetical protein GCM10011492_22060 [Flexivirga endophytica]GHB52015.1 hypothetical protein GCM10008112_21330 [Flexivirga endophytica]